MTLNLDPEIAAALAPMGEAMGATTPPKVGDITGRRAMWEPILAAASAALSTPSDVTRHVTLAMLPRTSPTSPSPPQ
jgi:hypothetical protein